MNFTTAELVEQEIADLHTFKIESPNEKYPQELGRLMASAVVSLVVGRLNDREYFRGNMLLLGLLEESKEATKDPVVGLKYAESFATNLKDMVDPDETK